MLTAAQLKQVERLYYLPEQPHRFVIVVNTQGEIAWSMSYANKPRTPPSFSWLAPPIATYPNKLCTYTPHVQGTQITYDYHPCTACQEAHRFFAAWIIAAWQSLLGLHRISSQVSSELDTVGIAPETYKLPEVASPRINAFLLTHHYRIVRHIDIAQSPYRDTSEPRAQRGSWVELLEPVDPHLVEREVREVPRQIRRLNHPRYTKYIQEQGTNEIDVRAHHKTIPLRRDSRRITKVTASSENLDQEPPP